MSVYQGDAMNQKIMMMFTIALVFLAGCGELGVSNHSSSEGEKVERQDVSELEDVPDEATEELIEEDYIRIAMDVHQSIYDTIKDLGVEHDWYEQMTYDSGVLERELTPYMTNDQFTKLSEENEEGFSYWDWTYCPCEDLLRDPQQFARLTIEEKQDESFTLSYYTLGSGLYDGAYNEALFLYEDGEWKHQETKLRDEAIHVTKEELEAIFTGNPSIRKANYYGEAIWVVENEYGYDEGYHIETGDIYLALEESQIQWINVAHKDQKTGNALAIEGIWESPYGDLSITDVTEDAFVFDVHLVMGNSVASMESKNGVVSRDGNGATFVVEAEGYSKPCTWAFHFQDDRLEVDASDECLAWHGVSATFTNTYQKQ